MQNVIEQATGAKLFLERSYISQKGRINKGGGVIQNMILLDKVMMKGVKNLKKLLTSFMNGPKRIKMLM